MPIIQFQHSNRQKYIYILGLEISIIGAKCINYKIATLKKINNHLHFKAGLIPLTVAKENGTNAN